MNSEQQKLQARCSTIGMVIRIFFWLWILLSIIRIGIVVWCTVLPAGQFTAVRQQMDTVLSIDKMRGIIVELPVEMAGPAAVLAHKKTAFLIGAWSHCLFFGFFCAVLWQFRCLFKGVDEEGAPFQKRHVRHLHRAGVFMILCGIVPYAVQMIVLMAFGMWGGTLFGDGALHNGGIWIFTGAVLLCLTQMFQYGCVLQTESDETL